MNKRADILLAAINAKWIHPGRKLTYVEPSRVNAVSCSNKENIDILVREVSKFKVE
ncbi:MAG: hypothetical protein LBS57_11230 [Treponema sp.]|jgi:hypothetical protein|nr:hypothetical protein [Treponema sp.]